MQRTKFLLELVLREITACCLSLQQLILSIGNSRFFCIHGIQVPTGISSKAFFQMKSFTVNLKTARLVRRVVG